MSGAGELTERVRARLRRDGVDPLRDPVSARRVAAGVAREHNDVALARSGVLVEDEDAFVAGALAAVSGFGPLQALLDDPEVEELWVNAPDRVFVARGGRRERTAVRLTREQVRDAVERMLHSTGRRVDLSTPFVDASLPDGSRLHVTIPDVTREWAVNVRKFLPSLRDRAALERAGMLSAEAGRVLTEAMRAGRSIIVSGATHAGKTTLLRALLAEVGDQQRLVTVEETFELALTGADVVAMQARQPNLEGTGEITLRRLVKEALRMRPDRIVVGEVRDAEALDLLLALNTGVPGAATVHANSARDALVRLSSLPLLAGRNIDAGFVQPAVASSVDLVAHCVLDADGRRRVDEIIAPVGGVRDGVIEADTVYRHASRQTESAG